jgi:hypothetical protein
MYVQRPGRSGHKSSWRKRFIAQTTICAACPAPEGYRQAERGVDFSFAPEPQLNEFLDQTRKPLDT